MLMPWCGGVWHTGQRLAALDCLRSLPPHVPAIAQFDVGTDLGITRKNDEWGPVNHTR